MSYQIRSVVHFSAGHRILGYKGKCLSPHGHSYRAELSLAGDRLDSLGLLADFGDIRSAMREWIDDHWNHAFLLNSLDTAMIDALKTVPESRIFLFSDANPTAENMARKLCTEMRESVGDMVSSASIWETQDQHAVFGV